MAAGAAIIDHILRYRERAGIIFFARNMYILRHEWVYPDI
jgi:hypothetical protein